MSWIDYYKEQPALYPYNNDSKNPDSLYRSDEVIVSYQYNKKWLVTTSFILKYPNVSYLSWVNPDIQNNVFWQYKPEIPLNEILNNQPKISGWHWGSEQLPKLFSHDTKKDPNGKIYGFKSKIVITVCKHEDKYFTRGNMLMTTRDNDEPQWIYFEKNDIILWQPLPEPMKAQNHV